MTQVRRVRRARSRSVLSLSLACLLAACGSTPLAKAPDAAQDDGVPPAAASVQSSVPAFEQKQRERALALGRQGRLADAALAWEILTVLKPDSAEYRDRLAEARKLVDAAAADRAQRGAQAFKRGELDNAAANYLAALALQPEQPQAADALRAIERERNKRNYLGKYSRITLTRRATMDAEVPGSRRSPAAGDRNDLEHASMLATQGEFDVAVQLLERHLAADRRDDAARQLLADVYYQKAEAIASRDKTAAIAALEKCVRLDATHARAAARLKQLKEDRGGGGDTLAAPRPAAKAER